MGVYRRKQDDVDAGLEYTCLLFLCDERCDLSYTISPYPVPSRSYKYINISRIPIIYLQGVGARGPYRNPQLVASVRCVVELLTYLRIAAANERVTRAIHIS